jgi:hypothetical protein
VKGERVGATGLIAALLLWASPSASQTEPAAVARTPGTVTGTVVDDSDVGIAGATIALFHDSPAPLLAGFSRADGQFSLSNVPPGPFRLAVSAPGFASQPLSGVVEPGGLSNLPPIRLTLALGAVSVEVLPTRAELAQRQIQEQEQQRLLGIVPNYFVSYLPDAIPLTARQKFDLSWKSQVDPFRFGVVGIIAGVQQARGDFSGFGQGAEGYAKRYGAAYATLFTGSAIRQVILPSVFKQDPRYFYKGTGSTGSRLGYALSRAVIKKGDNGRWQPNYSGVLGSLAAGALSNLYYPAENRKGVRLTFENTAIGIGGSAVGYLAQEFLFKRFTPHTRPASAHQGPPRP